MDLKTAFRQAAAHHVAGRLAEAERLYRAIADGPPGVGNDAKPFADAMHNAGLIAAASGRLDEGLALIERSVALAPRDLGYRRNLAVTLTKSARPGDGARAYAEARRALNFAPGDATMLQVFAQAATAAGHKREAADVWRRVVPMVPADATVRYNLGANLQASGQFAAAIDAYRDALRLRPGYGDALSNLASLLNSLERRDEALALLRAAAADGTLPGKARGTYAGLLVEAGCVGEGEAILDALAAAPDDDADVRDQHWLRHRAGAHIAQARTDEAFDALRRHVEANPAEADAFSCMVSAAQYLWPDDPAAHLALHRGFDRAFAAGVEPLPPVARAPLAGRRLRVGYVSGDLRTHSAGSFLEPLLTGHDAARVEVHCFDNSVAADAVTARVRARAAGWHEVQALGDDELAAAVRAAGIDVLVDCSGHTAGGRLLAFARRPAPVQLTYLGYSSTTGLSAIDGVITDAVADPPGDGEPHFVERPLRLPHVFAVFRAPAAAPEVAPAPSRAAGHVTLGSVGRLQKLTDATLDAWATGMRAAPTTRLLVVAKGADDPAVGSRLRARFADRGVGPHRLELVGQTSFDAYLRLHARVDLMLDTFPFNGHTTVVQNLWMGVPVVTFAGRSHRSRMAASVLSSIGLTELIAHRVEDFGPLIARWANDPEGLAALRGSMRERMRSSPLMDEPRFARDFEDLLIRAYEEFGVATPL